MPQGEDALMKAIVGQGVGQAPPEKKKSLDEKVQEAMDVAINAQKLKTIEKLNKEEQPAPAIPPGVDKELVGMFTAVATTLQGLVTAEREARISAENA